MITFLFPRRRVTMGIALAVLGVLIVADGCGGPGPASGIPNEDVLKAKIDPNLPLLKLPAIDLGHTVPGPDDEPAPEALGLILPASDFSILVQATRPADARGKPVHVTLRDYHRSKKSGNLLQTTGCFLKPTLQGDGTIRYEGTCTRPVRTGPSLLELRYKGKTLLLRSVDAL